ncbi:MAG: PLP-dependent aminotransferase family protein, partial [Propionicimonas sp.]
MEFQTNLVTLAAAPGDDRPRYARLAGGIRAAIRDGRLPAGAALPPSRDLAADLGCSRWVVTQAYEQLVAEGYLDARVGAGTRVRLAGNPAGSAPRPVEDERMPEFDLLPGLPDLRAFPRNAWARAWREALAGAAHAELGYPPAGGHPRLRRAVADYLGRVRGATVAPDDVTITAGVRDGMGRLARLLAGRHDRIAVEEPGWSRLRDTLAAAGLDTVPLAVDARGARTGQLDDTVRLAALTPAHHFPTGTVLAPERRAAALAWAERVDGLLLEDDYDAEFRYDRQPVGTLQG